MADTDDTKKTDLAETGIAGLDDVVCGGLTPNAVYAVQGEPGSGKTTLALQFLMAGARKGERGLLVTLSESAEELRQVAASHGWSLDGVDIVEILASEESLKPDARYTMFHPSEVELGETTRQVLEEVERLKPARIVFDSMSEFRMLAQNPHRFRRQVFAFKRLFTRIRCTVLLIDDRISDSDDIALHSIVHGVISLERHTPDYGPLRRRIQVTKLRGRQFREGLHDFRIERGGIVVFPRLVASEHQTDYNREAIGSGLPKLDQLLGGGLSRGTSTLLLGPAGSGKSSLAANYAAAAALRGEQAAIFLFDESVATFTERSNGLGIDVAGLRKSGRLVVRQVDPGEMSSGEFTHLVRMAVERDGARLVVIDSLNGYLNAMPTERLLVIHLHELLAFLGQRGVVTLLLMAQHGLLGVSPEAPVDTSYLADTVLLLRYFEARGTVRQAISVIKKRTGGHERTIRELTLRDGGIEIGEPLRAFQGVLTGMPSILDDSGVARGDGRTG